MKYHQLLILMFISFTFEFRCKGLMRELQSESDIPSTEPETIEVQTTLTFIVPTHTPDTTVPVMPEP